MEDVKVISTVQAGWIENNGRRNCTQFPMETCYLWMLAEMAPSMDPLVRLADPSRNFVSAPSLTFKSRALAEKFADRSLDLPAQILQTLRGTSETSNEAEGNS
jgi:hypothetical protein